MNRDIDRGYVCHSNWKFRLLPGSQHGKLWRFRVTQLFANGMKVAA